MKSCENHLCSEPFSGTKELLNRHPGCLTSNCCSSFLPPSPLSRRMDSGGASLLLLLLSASGGHTITTGAVALGSGGGGGHAVAELPPLHRGRECAQWRERRRMAASLTHSLTHCHSSNGGSKLNPPRRSVACSIRGGGRPRQRQMARNSSKGPQQRKLPL